MCLPRRWVFRRHTLNEVQAKASWYLRSLYVMPWVVFAIAVAVLGGGVLAIPLFVVAGIVALRCTRIGVAVQGGHLTVKNFWLTYRIPAGSVASLERKMRLGWGTAIGGPNSLLVVHLTSGAGVPVVASAFGRVMNHSSGRAVERVVAQLQPS